MSNRSHLRSDVKPRRAVTQHGFHPLTNAFHRIFEVCAFVVILRAARYVSVKWNSQIWRSIMPANGFIRRVCNRHFIEHLLIAHEHAGEVHHLTETDDAFPLYCLRHFFWTDMRAGRLKPRRGGNAGWHLYPNMDRLLLGLVHHQFDAFQAKDICHFMWVNEHTGCAAHSNRAHKLCDRHHARFDMHMSIEQTGHKVASLRIDDRGPLSNGVTRIVSNVGNMSIFDGDIRARDNLTRLDRHPFAIEDDKVSRSAPHGNVDKGAS